MCQKLQVKEQSSLRTDEEKDVNFARATAGVRCSLCRLCKTLHACTPLPAIKCHLVLPILTYLALICHFWLFGMSCKCRGRSLAFATSPRLITTVSRGVPAGCARIVFHITPNATGSARKLSHVTPAYFFLQQKTH